MCLVSFSQSPQKFFRPCFTHPRDLYPARPGRCSPRRTRSQLEASSCADLVILWMHPKPEFPKSLSGSPDYLLVTVSLNIRIEKEEFTKDYDSFLRQTLSAGHTV